MLTARTMFGYFMIVLAITAVLMESAYKETGKAQPAPAPSLMQLPSFRQPGKRVIQPTIPPPVQPTVQPTIPPTDQPTVEATIPPTDQPTVQPTPTPSILGSAFDPHLDIMAGPIDLPIELQIPSLKVYAPIIGVGLTSGNVMDAPEGPINDPIWQTAFWYRGSGIPGESGTSTIAGHVDDKIGQPQIFAHLKDLHPGDLILIHIKYTAIYIRFIIDQVHVYTLKESSDPAVLTRIYGAGPLAGTGPEPSFDGFSHLTLITCEGNWVNGEFDHHTVVYATRSK